MATYTHGQIKIAGRNHILQPLSLCLLDIDSVWTKTKIDELSILDNS
jgi:hypothetical protein